jgi:sirohydrochlorin ferrochelatase
MAGSVIVTSACGTQAFIWERNDALQALYKVQSKLCALTSEEATFQHVSGQLKLTLEVSTSRRSAANTLMILPLEIRQADHLYRACAGLSTDRH